VDATVKTPAQAAYAEWLAAVDRVADFHVAHKKLTPADRVEAKRLGEEVDEARARFEELGHARHGYSAQVSVDRTGRGPGPSKQRGPCFY
jgi:hypothetical protein